MLVSVFQRLWHIPFRITDPILYCPQRLVFFLFSAPASLFPSNSSFFPFYFFLSSTDGIHLPRSSLLSNGETSGTLWEDEKRITHKTSRNLVEGHFVDALPGQASSFAFSFLDFYFFARVALMRETSIFVVVLVLSEAGEKKNREESSSPCTSGREKNGTKPRPRKWTYHGNGVNYFST